MGPLHVPDPGHPPAQARDDGPPQPGSATSATRHSTVSDTVQPRVQPGPGRTAPRMTANGRPDRLSSCGRQRSGPQWRHDATRRLTNASAAPRVSGSRTSGRMADAFCPDAGRPFCKQRESRASSNGTGLALAAGDERSNVNRTPTTRTRGTPCSGRRRATHRRMPGSAQMVAPTPRRRQWPAPASPASRRDRP